MSTSNLEPETTTPAVRPSTRPFYWSVRREIWENRSIYIAPLVAAGVVLLGYLISLIHPVEPRPVRGGNSEAAKAMAQWIAAPSTPYDMATFVVISASLYLVAAFYCAGALHGERRDRSILFWKSLPVSDLTTVLSKAAVPLVVIPVVTMGTLIATQLVMLALGTAFIAAKGEDPASLWAAVAMPSNALVVIYLVAALALWLAPVWAWVLLVSGWAKRMPFLWAVGLPIAPCIVERIGLGTSRLAEQLGLRLAGGIAHAFTLPKPGVRLQLQHADPMGFLATPGLWLGLVVAAAFLAAAAWLRRRREPI
jgi:ABC-2 type transport system permease protein